MAGTVSVAFEKFFSLSRIEPFYPQALEALIELACRTGLHLTANFYQISRQFNPHIHEGIELWVYWGEERFAAIYYLTMPGQETLMARDYQFPHGQDDRKFPWATEEEGVAILAEFLEPIIERDQKFLGQRYRTLQELKKLRRQAIVA